MNWFSSESPEVLLRLNSEVIGGLCYLKQRLNQILLCLNVSVPVVNTSVDVSTLNDDYAKQVYGYSIIVHLRAWLTSVYNLLNSHATRLHCKHPSGLCSAVKQDDFKQYM